MKRGAGIQRRASHACYTAMLYPLTPRFIEAGEQIQDFFKVAKRRGVVITLDGEVRTVAPGNKRLH